jgi:FkbM family methyltransferase
MNLLRRVGLNAADVVSFGPQFLLRHLPRLTGSATASVAIPGIGRIHLRAGESDVAAVRQVFQKQEYDIASIVPIGNRIRHRYEEILKSNAVPVIVDAGANIGAASLWFLNKYPQAAVVAVEPEPGNLSILRKNADNQSRLFVLAAAIGSTEGFVSVKNEGLSWGAQTSRAKHGVPIVTMADAFRTAQGCPFIAKIDIEGFESDLFSHNLDWLNDVFVVYIEPHDWMLPGKHTSRSFQRAMGQKNFEIFIAGENLVFVRAE